MCDSFFTQSLMIGVLHGNNSIRNFDHRYLITLKQNKKLLKSIVSPTVSGIFAKQKNNCWLYCQISRGLNLSRPPTCVIWEGPGILLPKISVKVTVYSNYLDLISKPIPKNSLTKDFLICLFIYDKTCKSNKIKLHLEELLMSSFYWKG